MRRSCTGVSSSRATSKAATSTTTCSDHSIGFGGDSTRPRPAPLSAFGTSAAIPNRLPICPSKRSRSSRPRSSRIVRRRSRRGSGTRGDRPASNVRVSWTLDGVPLASERVSIAPRGTAVVRHSHTFPQTGIQAIGVEIDVADVLPDDNRRRLAVDVIEEVDVMIVDRRRGAGPLGGESDFLAIALSPFAFAGSPFAFAGSPFAFAGQDGGGAIRTRVVRPANLAAQIADARPDVVVLTGVPSLDESGEAAVASAVLRGSALVVFDGDRVEPARYNRDWGKDEATIRFPAALGDRVGGGDRDLASAEQSDRPRWRIDEPNAQFTAWDVLRRGDSRPFESVIVRAFRELRVRRGDTAPRVLLRLTGGEPIAVDHPQGAGRVVQFAIGCHPRWSSLPLRPVFVPMMQQLMLSLARSRDGLNLAVGEPIRIPLDEFAAVPGDGGDNRAPEGSVRLTVQPPGEAETPVTPRPDPFPSVTTPAVRPGVYRFRRVATTRDDTTRDDTTRDDTTRDDTTRDETTRVDVTSRVAEIPASESQLRDAPPDRIEAFAAPFSAKVYLDVETLRSDDSVRRFGREVWRWLLAALLVVMIGELLLARRTGGRAIATTAPRTRVAGGSA